MAADKQESPNNHEEDQPAGKVLSRRDFLKYAGIAGAAIGASGGLGGLLAACGGEETTTTTGGAAGAAGGPATTGAATTAVAAGAEPPAQDKLVFGGARPISGMNASFEQANFGPAYKLWVKDVNDAGGINVAGKKLPIELKIYDDQSDMDTCMRLLTKLIQEDKVDFIIPPCSTAFLFAAASVVGAAKKILISGEGGATSLEEEMAKGKVPLYFQVLNYSNHYQMPVFAEIMSELGAKTAAVIYLDDLHGIEYHEQSGIFWPKAGIEIKMDTAIPMDIKDASSVVKQAQQTGADILAVFTYPPQSILVMQTLQQLNYNPKVVLLGPGGASQWYADMFGGMEGVMFEGAWSINSSPEAKAYYEKLKAFVGDPGLIDFWGALQYRGELEFFQQAIEKAATLDQEKIAEVMRTTHFTTVLGDTFFTNQLLDKASYPGQIGQWQSGVAEVVDPGDKRTKAPIYPKPAWAPVTTTTPAS